MRAAVCIRLAAITLALLAVPCLAKGPEAELAEAKSAHARRDYLHAFKVLQPLASLGNAEAQLLIGLMYHHGHGVREDDAEAFRWIRRAALAGLADAQFHFGNMYALGFGVPATEAEPDREAARWYFEAARQGHAEAQHNLGILFLTGKGVVSSTEEAMRWFGRAAAGGHQESGRFVGGNGAPASPSPPREAGKRTAPPSQGRR